MCQPPDPGPRGAQSIRGEGTTESFGEAGGDLLQPVSGGGFVAVWAESTPRAARPPELQRYIDGALSNNMPFADSPSTKWDGGHLSPEQLC